MASGRSGRRTTTAVRFRQPVGLRAGGKHRVGADAQRLRHASDQSRTGHFPPFLDIPDVFSISNHILSEPLGEAKLAQIEGHGHGKAYL